MGIVASEDIEESVEAANAFTASYHYYHGNERMDVEYITDESGNVRNSYAYDAFGGIISSNETIPNRYTYNGEAYDKTTEQYYLRKRYYNPKLCRFTQEDEYRGDGLNLYAFCANNPVMYVDPSGYKCETGVEADGDADTIRRQDMSDASNEGKKVYVTDEDIDAYRQELGNPTNPETGEPRDTVAIGKTDIPGMEDMVFKGASPTIRKEAGLPTLDEQYPDRSIRAPWDTQKRGYGQFTRHAEEGVMAEFEKALIDAGINANDVKGTLYIHQSNSDGVCPMCTKGLFEPSSVKGIFKQLTEKYPNLNIVVTSDTRHGSPSGRGSLTFNVIDGIVTNWTKK